MASSRAQWVVGLAAVATLGTLGTTAWGALAGEEAPPTAAPATAPPTPTASAITVARVIDGDTLDVTREGQVVRVRLLNVDTPETVDPQQPVQCGGPAASDWLKSRLPAGTVVNLAYDVDRIDPYGRELAWVTDAQGNAINLEIVRRGLGAAVVFEPNHAHYPEMLTAQTQARSSGVGLFDEKLSCTLPAQVAQQVAALEAASAAAESAPAGASASAHAHLASALAAGTALRAALSGAGTTVERRMLEEQAVADLLRRLDHALSTTRDAETRLTQADEQHARDVEAAQSQRAADARESAAEDEAESKPSHRESRKSAPAPRETPQESTPDESEDESSGGSSGSKDGYTGRRCYAPGGKTYRPC